MGNLPGTISIDPGKGMLELDTASVVCNVRSHPYPETSCSQVGKSFEPIWIFYDPAQGQHAVRRSDDRTILVAHHRIRYTFPQVPCEES